MRTARCDYVAETLARTRLQLCGRIVIELDGLRLEAGLPGRKGRLLFAYLAANRLRAVSRDELAAVAWPEEVPTAVDANLRVLLSRLRRLLGAETLEGRRDLRLMLPSGAWIDLEAAEQKIHEAETAVLAEDWSRAVAAATIAFQISRRPFLLDEEAPWIAERRRWLDDVQVRALECDATGSLGIGGSELAACERDARRLIELAPYRESGHRLLMEALARRGNSAEALLVYEQLRSLLREELGVAPSASSQAVHRRLLEQGG